MRLLRLRVRHWRGLDAELVDFAPDLNLVVGPNEAGKSRLFEALHYALFQRYKGESEDKRALRSWTTLGEPTVDVEFECRGMHWRLHKRFLKQATARLEGDGRTLRDDEAEAKLRELWGTRSPERKKKDVEQYLGLWPLLWVGQGRAGVAPHEDMSVETRARLRDALGTELQAITIGGQGEALLARADREQARYWTKTGRETGELLAARTAFALAEQAHASAARARGETESLRDALDACIQARTSLDGRLREQRASVARHETVWQSIHEQAALLERLRHRVSEAEDARARARHAADVRAQACVARETARATAAQWANELVATEARAKTAEGALREAHEAWLVAARAESAALERRHHAAKAAAAVRARSRIVEIEAQRARHQDTEKRVAELRAQIALIHVDAHALKKLRQVAERALKARLALEAASAHLRVRTKRPLVIDGKPIPANEELVWSCAEATTIAIDGVLDLQLVPGGPELATLQAADLEASRELQHALLTAHVRDLEEAEAQYARRTVLEAQRGEAERALHALPAPSILDEELAQMRAQADAGDPDPSLSLEAAEEDAARAQRTTEEALREKDHAHRAWAEEHARLVAARSALEQSQSELAAREAAWALGPPDEVLALALEKADEHVSDAHRALADQEAKHHALAPDDARETLEREKRVFERWQREWQELREKEAALRATLQAASSRDVYAAWQDAEERLTEAANALEAVTRSANAAQLLVNTLRAERERVHRDLLAPVVRRVKPYLQELFPASQLALDPAWNVLGLQSGDVLEEFRALSCGAREQLGMVVRLALGEALSGDERVPVILDDCFVNTDAARRETLFKILYRASKKLQIVLLTCHDEAFERLGESKRFLLGAGRPRVREGAPAAASL